MRVIYMAAFMLLSGSASASWLCPEPQRGDPVVRTCDPNRDGYNRGRASAPEINNDVPGAPDVPTGPNLPDGPTIGGGPVTGGGGGCIGCTPTPTCTTCGGGGDDGGGGTPGTGKGRKNNGFGNGDQDAPGRSEFHNGAENKGGNHDGTNGACHGHNC